MPMNQLHRFDRLDYADDTRQHAEHTQPSAQLGTIPAGAARGTCSGNRVRRGEVRRR
jgi:hypothetical protein